MIERSFILISGGQSGVDRAALEFAHDEGISHGGWCPRDRAAEDGAISERFLLRETVSADPAVRSMLNVMDSDGTVIFRANGSISPGTDLTAGFARLLERPLLELSDDEDIGGTGDRFFEWMVRNRIETLNVAGPRKSEAPLAGAWVKSVLKRFFRTLSQN